jgi:hypothetical protein
VNFVKSGRPGLDYDRTPHYSVSRRSHHDRRPSVTMAEIKGPAADSFVPVVPTADLATVGGAVVPLASAARILQNRASGK